MAITLRVENFSCLKDVTFEVAPVTVLIGPQGSGKSLLAKLHYFFCDLMTQYHHAASRRKSFAEYRAETLRRFVDWFPPATWGSPNFAVELQAGPFTARITGKHRGISAIGDVDVAFSDFFAYHYENTADAYRGALPTPAEHGPDAIRHAMDSEAGVYEASQRLLAQGLGMAYVDAQTYLPAGRAIIAGLGATVAFADDHGFDLDPISLGFMRTFNTVRRLAIRRNSQFVGDFAEALLGGTLSFEEQGEFVLRKDGRRIPRGFLSSGQQEVLPVYLIVSDPILISRSHDNGLVFYYVEEPDAHLFPAAQGMLLDFLISNLSEENSRRYLTMTTHSPYVLTKLNGYLKAGIIARDGRKARRVAKVVRKDCWLTPDRLRVYAVADGKLEDVVDEDGLIDGSCIDNISEETSRTFSRLLDIQFPDTA